MQTLHTEKIQSPPNPCGNESLGAAGSKGGTLSISVSGDPLNGALVADSLSSITIRLKNSARLEGAIIIVFSLKVIDVSRREAAALVNDEMSSRTCTRQWDVAVMVSGIYLYRLPAGAHSKTVNLLLSKLNCHPIPPGV